MQASLVGLEGPWENVNEWITLLDGIQRNLGCAADAEFLEYGTTSRRTTVNSPVSNQDNWCSGGADECISAQCQGVLYCGPGRTGNGLAFPAGPCLNSACYDHDHCSFSECVSCNPPCYFSPQSSLTGCDVPLFERCSTCIAQDGQLAFADMMICSVATALDQLPGGGTLGADQLCYGSPCGDHDGDCTAQTCNPDTSVCDVTGIEADGSPCDDGAICLVGETCQSGVCTVGTPSVCSPGQVEVQSCGFCGSQSRTCTPDCGWGAWSACSGEGVCAPGATDLQSCGNCGNQSRTCTPDCAWGTWSECSGEGVCTPGAIDVQACGNCGSRSRTCTPACGWGAWSACGGEGVCTPGATETQVCGNCGIQSRSCTASCDWPTWGTCTGEGVCTPSSTRSCPDACGTQICGAGCIWTSCDFNWDNYEPNETFAQATYLGQIDEGEPMPPVTDAWLHQAEPPTATPGEIDRYYFYCYESGNVFDWSMTMSASLSGVGGWHSLCIFYDRGCNGSVEAQHCSTGEGTLDVSTGDVDGASSASDDGCIDVEVYGDGSCSAYTLQLICD